MADKWDLEGRVALITGASSGIGAETARFLNEAGMNLVLTARSEDDLNKLAGEMREATVVALDVTGEGAAQSLIDRTLSTYGQIDVLINNAGMMMLGEVDEIDLEKAMFMVRLNTEAAFRLAILAARKMKERGEGFIVNTASVAAIEKAPGMEVYAATKAAMDSFSQSLRIELGPKGVRIASILPGTVETELYDDWDEDKKAQMGEVMLQSADIARTVLFVLEQPAHSTIARVLVVPTGSEV